MIFKIKPLFNLFELTSRLGKVFAASKTIIKYNISYYPKEVIDLEESMASLVGRKYSLSFNSGTSALDSLLWSLDLNKEDLIYITNSSFHSVENLCKRYSDNVLRLGSLRDALLQNRTPKVIIVTHSFGYADDVEIIESLRQSGVYVIEDCSHAHGAFYRTRPLGSFGNSAFFSLQGAKGVAAGEGGVCVTDDQDTFLKMSYYAHFNRHVELWRNMPGCSSEFGFGRKYRINPLGASIACCDLEKLTTDNIRMNVNANKLEKLFYNMGFNVYKSNPDVIPGGRFGGLPFVFNVDKFESFKKVYIVFEQFGFPLTLRMIDSHRVINLNDINDIQHIEFLFCIDRKILYAPNFLVSLLLVLLRLRLVK